MSGTVLLIHTLAVITIGMLFIYLYGMLIRRYRAELMVWERWIAGLFFAVAVFFSTLAARTLFSSTLADGKLALLAVGTVFYGPQAAGVIALGVMLSQILVGEPVNLFLLCNIAAVIGLGLLYRHWLSQLGHKRFYGPMALLGILVVVQGLIWSRLFGLTLMISDQTIPHILVTLLMAPAVTMATGGIFLMEMERRDKEMDLIHSKEELTAQNEEITALYEEMAATEETLQEQYDQLREHREELIRINDRYQLIYQAGNEGLWEYDYATKETLLSDRLSEIYGYGPDRKDFLIRERDNLIHPEDLPRVYANWRALNRGIIQSYDMEYRILHGSGEYRWIQAKGIILRDEQGKNLYMAGSHGDIHQRKVQEQKLYESAYYDTLTGLPNREWFMEQLEACLAETIATHDVGAVLMLGLDDFKIINDTMGHESGDRVLQEVSCRLSGYSGERKRVARLSGDEFLILLSSIQQRHDIEAEIVAVLERIRQPMTINGSEIIITASLGAVLFPKDAQSTDMVFRNGDIALQHAKNIGNNAYVFFDDKMAKDNMRRMQLDNGLKTAVRNQEVSLNYQPIFCAHSRQVVGFEALARWSSPEFGYVSPAEFIGLAEQNGQIVELGNWALREACSLLKRLDAIGHTEIYVSVNLSPVQLLQKDFVAQIREILVGEHVSPERIVLEITETALMESFEACRQKIMVLKDWGLNFSLDDFGTGYSSLNYLRSIPVKTLKIDKCFVDDLLRDQKLQRLVRTIIDISHDLDLKVVAEGVEEDAQLMLLGTYGCDCIQGYLLGRPMPETQVLQLLDKP